ncbi:MAG TPA: hypothetical protein VEI97_11025, partial [bacterium]|nr:hypothetical protein [bacterium]
MTRTALLCSGLAALAALGCAGQSPTAVDQAPSNGSQAVWESAPALGIYHLEGKAGGELSLSPVARASQALGDSFSVDITSIAGPNFRLSGIEFLADGSLRATFAFKHPLPDTTSRKDLHVFDLRMHVLSPTVGTTFGGAAGLSAPTGADGASEELKQAATGLTNADGWSTWGDEIVEPAIGSLAPNLYPYKLIHEDTARPIPLNADAPAGWNVVPQSNATYTVAAIFKLTAGQSVDLFLGLDASYGNSAVGQRVIPKPDPGGRLNPRYLNPEFNLKEAWKTE